MNIVVVSPHPDDETLGAGGTILRLKSEGDKVFWLNVTGMTKDGRFSELAQNRREEQLRQIADFYKFEEVYNLDLPTSKLDSYDTSDAIDKIGEVFRKIEPEMLILPDYNDAHSDHKKVFEWCYSCSKIFRFPYIKKILTMEIVSETDFGKPENPFVPNFYVDITDYLQEKIRALNIYDTELGDMPFPRSIEHIIGLATVRGAAAGVRYAEAFRVIKYIV